MEEKQIKCLFKRQEINFLTEYYWDWNKIKGHIVNELKKCNDKELFFLAHKCDKLIGKAQLVMEVKQKIPLIQKIRTIKNDEPIISYKFIDERHDRRYDGHEMDSLAFEFWVYKLVNNGSEYILLSKERLGNELYTFKGMKIEMAGTSEVSKVLKFHSVANVFIVAEYEPAIKILKKKELVQLCKTIGLTNEIFRGIVFLHPDGNVYEQPQGLSRLQVIQLLSGKYEGYPLHLMIIGDVGTGKTMLLECLNYKFKEEEGIFEAGNSTVKGLIPSFKEKPANPGYILLCVRIALTDELMKMIENAQNQTVYKRTIHQSLSQLNMLLEHKERTVGSGNDNNLKAKATAKAIFATNPLKNSESIFNLIFEVDKSTLSRMLLWVQGERHRQERRKLKNNNTSLSIYTTDTYDYRGVIINPFLTIYDSCQSFLVDFDEKRIEGIIEVTAQSAKEPMKGIWEARALHHAILLFDGIVKYRCLFQDYDDTFMPNEADYNDLEALLKAVIASWDTKLMKND